MDAARLAALTRHRWLGEGSWATVMTWRIARTQAKPTAPHDAAGI
jgi:hypothetical protein